MLQQVNNSQQQILNSVLCVHPFVQLHLLGTQSHPNQQFVTSFSAVFELVKWMKTWPQINAFFLLSLVQNPKHVPVN